MAAKKPLFELLDHCCRICGGRLLASPAAGGMRSFRCAECGSKAVARESERAGYQALCFCGVRLANGTDAGLRCRRVDSTPERPQEVVVKQDAPRPPRAQPVPARPVRPGGAE